LVSESDHDEPARTPTMHLFLSAGEPSGDLHGANLIRAIRARHPHVKIVGYGGEKMRDAGADLHYPLADLAVMWFGRVLTNFAKFVRLANRARDYFHTERPDALVVIDYPGFNFAIAKRAAAAGIPVYYVLPPQLWAWAGWRIKKIKKYFTGVLTTKPFEDEWYRARGVETVYVGHPYFDELVAQKLDPAFLAERRAKSGRVVSILPGSRNQEVTGNVPLMIAAAKKVHAARPDTRFLVASFSEPQAAMAREMFAPSNLPVEIHVGRTPEIIELGEACISVSGSVGLELMYRLTPSVVVYRVGRFWRWLARRVMTTKFISLVNLHAGEEVFPEFLTSRDESDRIAAKVLHWLNDPAAHAATVEKLRELRDRIAVPGACERAAEYLVNEVGAKISARPAKAA
jgi:lipid-A-disaccharide synthase